MPSKQYLSQTWADPHLVIRDSRIHGCGVFSTREFQIGEIIMIWGGKTWTLQDALEGKARWKSLAAINHELYIGNDIHDPVTIDEYLNHACDANTWMLDEVTVIARHVIPAGVEITSDMALWTDEDYIMTTDCRCGSPVCRHQIGGFDWMLPDVQARYHGHFSPFINRKIAALDKRRGA
jgi:uncharacterized protein